MASAATLYDHYTAGGITTGLSASNGSFTLNNKAITLYSGAVHYFRVPQEYWRDRLRKVRAAGLNAVETYVPWNLHEPAEGVYDFGTGGTEFETFLDVAKFLKTAQEEDLLAIVRPGPYICSEWDFGGMPSWLLRDDTIKLRTSDKKFISYVEKYFKMLFNILSVLQFTNGGPIIAFQIENEYGNVKVPNKPIYSDYLIKLKDIVQANGVKELLFTSDTPSNGFSGAIPGILYTANFQSDTTKELDLLKSYQPDKAFMVMEYWTGWFDHWGEKHHTRSNEDFSRELNLILNYPASVNFYMFHGGTNWGFLNGANIKNNYLTLDTSSYDYDAPLSEAGDYTDKYESLQNIIAKHNKIPTRLPSRPLETQKFKYPTIDITNMLKITDVINKLPQYSSERLLPMEAINQNYGYIIYRKTNLNINPNTILKILGNICDTLLVLINGDLKSPQFKCQKDLDGFGFWKLENGTLDLGNETYRSATLDLVVENFGRNNFGTLDQFDQKKGLWQGEVYLNDQNLRDWKIYPLEFKKDFSNGLSDWRNLSEYDGPAIYKAELIIDRAVDTFVDLRNWKKGIVIVNGFVLSRYFRIGPQQTAYLPAPFLRAGTNDILIFEHYKAAGSVHFSEAPIFETLDCV